jgi:hypothetical protein
MSHGRAAAAMRNGVFDDEIVAVLAPIERRLVEYSVRPSEGILCGSDLLTYSARCRNDGPGIALNRSR